MPHWSRRHALQASGSALFAALAGCNGTESVSRSVPRNPRDSLEDVTILKIRNTAGTPMVVERSDETTSKDTGGSSRRRGHMLEHVTDEPDQSMRELVFPEDVPGAQRLRTFFAETDFETQSIYLQQAPVRACYKRRLQGVFREDDGVDAEFCRDLRPADVACEADAWATTVFAIRLQFPGDDFSSVGSGGSSSCRHPYLDPVDPDTSLVVGPNEGGSE